MKRPLKPNERIALFAALIAVGGGLTPLLVRGSQSPEGFLSGDFIAGLLLGLIGVLLVAGVAWWLKGRAAD